GERRWWKTSEWHYIELISAGSGLGDLAFDPQGVCARGRERVCAAISPGKDSKNCVPIRIVEPPVSIWRTRQADIVEKETVSGVCVELINIGLISRNERSTDWGSWNKRARGAEIDQLETICTRRVSRGAYRERVRARRQ